MGPYDRNRVSIMIGPSKINNDGITFTLFAHTNREYGVNITLKINFHYTSINTDRSDHPQSGRRRDSRGEPGVITETRRY